MIVSNLDLYHTQPTENSKEQPKATQSNPKQHQINLNLEMTTTTQQFMTEFTALVDTEKEYTRSELGKLLTEVFHQINSGKKISKKQKTYYETDDEPKTKKSKKTKSKKTKSKKTKSSDDDAEPKKKREPTLYNLFVKEQMPLVKEEFPDLNRQDLMRKIGENWKAHKETEAKSDE